MPQAGDDLFWARMNSTDEKFDTPGMSSVEKLPGSASYDVIVATSAGKPLYHYGHRPNRDEIIRPFQHLAALSAACVAFTHATNGNVRVVRIRQGTAFFGRFSDIHVVASTTEPDVPVDILHTLGVAAVTAVYFLASAAFAAAMVRRPGLDLGVRSDEVSRVATKIIRRALLYPMALQNIPSQPCSHAPRAVRRLSGALATAQKQRRIVTHTIVFSACPPFPHRVLACASPVYHQLTPSDLFLISAILPLNVKEQPLIPERVFLQAYSYQRASLLTVQLVEPRLADLNAFMKDVGGESWRPQWCADGNANTVWVVSIADLSMGSLEQARKFGMEAVIEIEKKIDKSPLASDVWVWMERPFRAVEVCDGVKAIVSVRNNRIVATLGALDYEFALEALKIARIMGDGMRFFCRRSSVLGCWIVANEDTFVFVQDKDNMEDSVDLCSDKVLPWLKSNLHLLFSPHSIVSLPPDTPLSFLLAPFES